MNNIDEADENLGEKKPTALQIHSIKSVKTIYCIVHILFRIKIV